MTFYVWAKTDEPQDLLNKDFPSCNKFRQADMTVNGHKLQFQRGGLQYPQDIPLELARNIHDVISKSIDINPPPEWYPGAEHHNGGFAYSNELIPPWYVAKSAEYLEDRGLTVGKQIELFFELDEESIMEDIPRESITRIRDMDSAIEYEIRNNKLVPKQ